LIDESDNIGKRQGGILVAPIRAEELMSDKARAQTIKVLCQKVIDKDNIK
jgi:hypothetical protein